jgi:Type I phosphodiesterase / nucleotide pyrophosphatase
LHKSRAQLFAILAVFLLSSAFAVPRGLALTAGSRRSSAIHQAPGTKLKTRAVVLIVLDGFRWQEVFDGPAHELMNAKYGGVQDEAQLKKDFWRETPEEGRATLMPFLWTVVAKQGQIYGNQKIGSVAQVTNGLKFSYPGYNEMSTGYPDKKINSNEVGVNPNATVFEWLNKKADFRDQVAIFGTWNTFNDIFRVKQSGLYVRAGWDLPWAAQLSPPEQRLKILYETTTRVEDDDAFDSFTHQDLLDYLGNHKPKALFVGYGGTDDWAHEGKYDLVLQAAHQDDQHIEELWNLLQANPEYRDKVTFIITTDHGRGSGLKLWRDHDYNIAGAENIWIAVIGPDTPAKGEMKNVPRVTQSQIAATIAALLGEDYRGDVPQAAPPLPVVDGWSSQKP